MVFGERLKSARVLAGLSLRDLAQRVGVSAQAISKYERGLDMPGSAIVIRLAQALGVRVEYLLRPPSVSLSAPSFRCRAALSQKQQAAVQAQVKDWLERYLTIESILGEAQIFQQPAISRRVESLEDTERVAQALRGEWKLGLDPIPNLTETLEAHGIKVGFVQGCDDFDALTFMANEAIPVIVIKAGIPGDRQRMNLAHELGHLLLEMPDDWTPKQAEAAAFRFAGAFLAPEPSARQELGDRRQTLDLYELRLLKHKYGMSMQAWIYRAKDLGILPRTAAENLFRQFRTRGWHRQEPGAPCPPETTDRLERLILRALSEGLISEARAAELLGVGLDEFWQRVRAQHEDIPVPLRP